MVRAVKKILIIFLTMSVILSIFAGFYIYNTLSEAGDRLSNSLVFIDDNKKYGPSVIEAHSTFKKNDLLNYLSFSSNLRRPKELFRSFLSQKSIEKSKNGYYFAMEDIQIDPLNLNHCNLAYCYQHKINFSKIPSTFWKGLMGIEDYRFLEHFGIDFISILRAIITDIKAMKLVQGGSTLTQQLVKNLYFNNKKTFSRKIKEIIIAVYLERKYEKEDILESYFNEVFWGSYNGVRIKGIFSASLIYFGKKPRQVTSFEAAILIGMLKGPSFYSPLHHMDRIRKRSLFIFEKLKKLGLTASVDDQAWSETDFRNWKKFLTKKNKSIYLDTLWQVSKKAKALF